MRTNGRLYVHVGVNLRSMPEATPVKRVFLSARVSLMIIDNGGARKVTSSHAFQRNFHIQQGNHITPPIMASAGICTYDYIPLVKLGDLS